MNLIYGIKDKPSFGKVVLFALQQLLAIMAATIAVPAIIGNGLTASAALFGAGVGTVVYLLFTKSSSPVFLGSSFAFIGSMMSAFGGAASVSIGYWGLIIGAIMAGLVYVVLALIVKFCGVAWIDKLMPPVIIGPTVAIIGLSLSANAVGDLMKSSVEGGSTYVALICGLVTLAVTMLCSTYGKKIGRLIPFILGILA
jgi:uracil permease